MTLRFTVSGRIARPVHDVFEAVADPDQLSGFFTTNGAKGRLETGATVIWDFADFPGAFPVHVVEVEQDRRIVLRWQAADSDDDPYETTVTMEFEQLDDGRTLVTIAEEGWRETAAGQE
ncbi:MAG: SRPBCC domain-containing protein, partial [Ilumatobacteraceae bacterium]